MAQSGDTRARAHTRRADDVNRFVPAHRALLKGLVKHCNKLLRRRARAFVSHRSPYIAAALPRVARLGVLAHTCTVMSVKIFYPGGDFVTYYLLGVCVFVV